MKPRTIFIAVAAVCMVLMGLLPRLSHAPRAMAASTTYRPKRETPAAMLPIPPSTSTRVPAALSPTAAGWSDAPVVQLPRTANDGDRALDGFAHSLVNGQASSLVGAYAAGIFALPVVEQPLGDDTYVSEAPHTLTHYRRPAGYQVTGLLAHNTLSGSAFSDLVVGQTVTLIYGDETRKTYQVMRIERYQALQPDDPFSDFVDLADPQARILSHTHLFQSIYTHPGQLVLQTCIDQNGNASWGRLFVIAEPLD